jgi:hypothetical protein
MYRTPGLFVMQLIGNIVGNDGVSQRFTYFTSIYMGKVSLQGSPKMSFTACLSGTCPSPLHLKEPPHHVSRIKSGLGYLKPDEYGGDTVDAERLYGMINIRRVDG